MPIRKGISLIGRLYLHLQLFLKIFFAHGYQAFLFNINNSRTVVWFQIFLSKPNNLYTLISLQVIISVVFDDILLRHCNAVYNQNPIDRWMKGCILPFPKKGDLVFAENYRGITLTSIAAKIYNALLRNRIEPKIDNILRKKQNGFRRNRSTTSQILTIRRILEGVQAKKTYRRHYYLSTLPRPLIPFTEVRWNKSY